MQQQQQQQQEQQEQQEQAWKKVERKKKKRSGKHSRRNPTTVPEHEGTTTEEPSTWGLAGWDTNTTESTNDDEWDKPTTSDLPALVPKETRNTRAFAKGRCEHGMRFYSPSDECPVCRLMDLWDASKNQTSNDT